jgi:hypothetical protein
MLSRLKRLIVVEPPAPNLDNGEEVVLEGKAVLVSGWFVQRWGPLLLTNRRLIWNEASRPNWPFKPITGQVPLTEIASVDKGTLLDFIGGGRRLRLRLRNGKDKCFLEAEGKLDEWIETMRSAIARAEA